MFEISLSLIQFSRKILQNIQAITIISKTDQRADYRFGKNSKVFSAITKECTKSGEKFSQRKLEIVKDSEN